MLEGIDSLRVLGEAILGNSLELVEDILKRSLPTPSQSLPMVGCDFGYINPKYKSNTNSFSSISSENFVARVTFLHMAIYAATVYNETYNFRPLAILRHLLNFSTSSAVWKGITKEKGLTFVLFNVKQSAYNTQPYGGRAIDFAISLKNDIEVKYIEGQRIHTQLDKCISILLAHDSSIDAAKNGPIVQVETVAVPISMYNTLSSLLFSSNYADVVFKVAGGNRSSSTEPEPEPEAEAEQIFGHKCILASSSDYMNCMLTGAWAENSDSSCTVINSPYSSSTIKTLLKFIYTGKVDTTAVTNTMEVSITSIIIAITRFITIFSLITIFYHYIFAYHYISLITIFSIRCCK